MVFTQVEAALMAVLPKGRDNARTAKELGDMMGARVGRRVDARYVRKVVSQLRLRGVLIGSSPREPRGFYFPGTLDEAEGCYRELLKRLRQTERVVKTYRRNLQKARVAEMARQAELPLIGLERGA